VVEIGCIELLERARPAAASSATSIPAGKLDLGAQEVTGLTLEFLQDKPLFGRWRSSSWNSCAARNC
jgi:DNA polymerase-3 subunit epsilon